MTTRLTLLAAIAAALAAPTAASAGAWATVGFDPPPDDLAPGEPWQVEMTVLQHGTRPLEGLEPRVIVAPAEGGGRMAFPARATGEPGVYRATVVFASEGMWRYRVDDGFMGVHSYPPVRIGEAGRQAVGAQAAFTTPGTPGDDGPNYPLAVLAAAAAALVAALGAAALGRRRGGADPAGG
jgi:hypothetical protein